jgi:hypothetical protein
MEDYYGENYYNYSCKNIKDLKKVLNKNFYNKMYTRINLRIHHEIDLKFKFYSVINEEKELSDFFDKFQINLKISISKDLILDSPFVDSTYYEIFYDEDGMIEQLLFLYRRSYTKLFVIDFKNDFKDSEIYRDLLTQSKKLIMESRLKGQI